MNPVIPVIPAVATSPAPTSPSATVVIDYPADDRVAAMRIGGMSVLERILREAARAGATRAIVRADAARVPALPGLALTVEVLGRDAAVPAEAAVIAGDVIGGVRVTDRASARVAMRALLRACRRSYDGVADRYVIRYASLPLTGVLSHTPVTPNQVTVANIAVGLAACWYASRGTTLGLALAGGLFLLQLVLDSIDGELARIRHRHSRVGMTLDNVGDDVVDNLFVAALGWGLGGPWVWIGAGAALGRGLVAIMVYVELISQGHGGDLMAFHWWFDRPDATPTERFTARVTPMTVVRALGRRDLYGLVFGVTCLVGLPVIGLGLGVAISCSSFAFGVMHAAHRLCNPAPRAQRARP